MDENDNQIILAKRLTQYIDGKLKTHEFAIDRIKCLAGHILQCCFTSIVDLVVVQYNEIELYEIHFVE